MLSKVIWLAAYQEGGFDFPNEHLVAQVKADLSDTIIYILATGPTAGLPTVYVRFQIKLPKKSRFRLSHHIRSHCNNFLHGKTCGNLLG